MTIGNVSTVATWIAGLTYTGITAVSVNAIPDAVNAQDCPLLMPDMPFMTDFQYTRLSFRDSNAGRQKMCTYVLHWKLYHSVVSEGVTFFEMYKPMIDAWSAIINVLTNSENPTGAYDARPQNDPEFGAYKHAVTGADFWGCKFSIWIQEFST